MDKKDSDTGYVLPENKNARSMTETKDDPSSETTKYIEHVEDSRIDELRAANADTRWNRRLRLKMDTIILPLLTLGQLLAYMDRNTIGYARPMGLQKDLHMSDAQFEDAVAFFYVSYLVFVIPTNVIIQHIGARLQLGGALVFFGTIACCQAAARNYPTLAGLRILLGLGEALWQSFALYAVAIYGRQRLAKRIGVVYSASTLAGAFAGLIAFAVQGDFFHSAQPTWAYLFEIEGGVAIGIGLLCIALLPEFPHKISKFWILKDQELEILKAENRVLDGIDTSIQWHQARQCFTDVRTYLLTIVVVTVCVEIAAMGAFLPTVVRGFGFSAQRAQLMTTIPYALAFVTMNVTGQLSDYCNNKGSFIIGCFSACVVGLIVLISKSGQVAGMAGACLVIMGLYGSTVLIITWVQISFAGRTKRAVVAGFTQLCGQGTSIAAAHFYTDPPRFIKGHSILLGFNVAAIIATALIQYTMKKQNDAKDKAMEAYSQRNEVHPDVEVSIEEVCDKHILFRYVL